MPPACKPAAGGTGHDVALTTCRIVGAPLIHTSKYSADGWLQTRCGARETVTPSSGASSTGMILGSPCAVVKRSVADQRCGPSGLRGRTRQKCSVLPDNSPSTRDGLLTHGLQIQRFLYWEIPNCRLELIHRLSYIRLVAFKLKGQLNSREIVCLCYTFNENCPITPQPYFYP